MKIIPFIIGYEMYGESTNLFIKIQELLYIMEYLNPLGASDFSFYFVNRMISTTLTPDYSIVNPGLVIASSIFWIVLLLLVGWRVFKKANLST